MEGTLVHQTVADLYFLWQWGFLYPAATRADLRRTVRPL